MRLKKKRQLKKRRGAQEDDEAIAVLASQDEQSESEEQSEEAPSTPVEVVKKPLKKRVKLDPELNEEDRALALLGNDDF